jgi:hypothetical protein
VETIDSAASDPAMRARAAALGRRIEAEDKGTRAIQVMRGHPALARHAHKATSVAATKEGWSTVSET